MKTKKTKTKRKTKKGSGVGLMKEMEPLKVYDKLLSVCSFKRLSFGAFGYTYIASLEDDVGFRNEKGETVRQFLVKVVPLDSKEREPYFFMRTKGDMDYVVPTYELKADHEFHIQQLLYQRGLERGYELCPSPLYLVRSPVPELPPNLLEELEFSMDEFKTIIPHEKNKFQVNLIVMEYFEDAVTIHSIVHGDWDEKKIGILKASTDISGEDYDIVDTNHDFRFSEPCVQSLLARVRRQFIAVYDCGIIHGDPSLSNCLINTSGKITVIDFGLAREMRTDYRGLDDYHKIHFILNSCEYPNAYKWLYKNYLHELVGDRKKTKITYQLFSQPNLLPKGWKVYMDDVLTYTKGVRSTTKTIPYNKFYIKIAEDTII